MYNQAMERRIKKRVISGRPMVIVGQIDYGLSHSNPLAVNYRSSPLLPMTFYNAHAGVEVGILLSGREERIFPDCTLSVQDGDVWLAAMWEVHGIRSTTATARVLSLIFLPEFLGDLDLGGIPWFDLFAVPPSQRPKVEDETMRRRIRHLGEILWEETEQRPVGWSEATRFNLSQVLLYLRRAWRPPHSVTTPAQERGNILQRLMPALSVGYADPSESVSLAEAAAGCGLSTRHFTRLFRQTMGISFAQFRLRARIVAASNLLLTTDLSSEAIAEQTGFVDPSHLHRTFVKQYGCTPSDYRRRFRAPSASLEGEFPSPERNLRRPRINPDRGAGAPTKEGAAWRRFTGSFECSRKTKWSGCTKPRCRFLAPRGCGWIIRRRCSLVQAAGGRVDFETTRVFFPREVTERAVDQMRRDFTLADRQGVEMPVRYSQVHFSTAPMRVRREPSR